MAKMLFLCNQVRPDILTGVDFLTAQVRNPDEDNDKCGNARDNIARETRTFEPTKVSGRRGDVKR